MSLKVQFVLLSVSVRAKEKNEPKTVFAKLTFGNNLGDKFFSQKISCDVTLDQLSKTQGIDEDLRQLLVAFMHMPTQTTSDWLKEFASVKTRLEALFLGRNKRVFISFVE